LINKVFITGGTGFLGGYIIQTLVQKGYQVTALRRSDRLPFFIDPVYFKEVNWIKGDLFDTDALYEGMKDADAVIHSAAMVSLHASDRALLYKNNVEGTANVVNVAIETGIQRFVHVSSIAAIGRLESGGLVNEDQKWDAERKTTYYAKSKYQAELEVWRGMAEGLNGVIANPSTILGYGDWDHSSCAIFKNVYQEFPWYTNGINGFVDVQDVAEAIVRLMKSDRQNERYIISAENWSFRDLFNAIADGFQKRRPSKRATPLLSGIAWRLELLKSLFTRARPLLTSESARVANSITRFSNEKLLDALPGFTFTPLEETVQRACRDYLAHWEKGKKVK
jgi:nucleoside-diphosphate-sugar epimerase